MAVGSNYAAWIRAAGAIYWPIGTRNFAPLSKTAIFRGVDLSGAAFAAQVRALPDAGGAALLTLTCAPVLISGDTWLTVSAIETAIEGLPPAAELGRNSEFYWDCDMTPVGGVKQMIFGGEFVRIAGVSQ